MDGLYKSPHQRRLWIPTVSVRSAQPVAVVVQEVVVEEEEWLLLHQ